MKKIFKTLLCLLLLIGLTGCQLFKNDEMDEIDIYTTIYPINYLIKTLYGEHANIYSIYPTGVDFKTYNLSDKKINEFAKSSLFVFNSLDEERNYAVKMINKNKDLKLIDTSYGMNYDYGIEELWLDPYNYLMMAKNVKTNLNEYLNNPYLIEEVNKNYETLQYDLSKLDAAYKETLKDAKYKTILTDNSSFNFLKKYNIEVISLEEDIKNITIKEGDTIAALSNKYNISISDILTYNNKVDENVTPGDVIKIPIKVIDSANVSLAKKLINSGKIKYVYTTNENSNSIVNKLIQDYKLEKININDMYNIDGKITNSNETYLTIMNDNLELLKKELDK